MGQLVSRMISENEVAEIFMISFLSQRGITPYTMPLLPGGPLRRSDDRAEVRSKFQAALTRQRQLEQALTEIRERDTIPSPCLVREFIYETQSELQFDPVYKEVTDVNGKVSELQWKAENKSILKGMQSRQSGLGTLEKLKRDSGRKDSIQISDVMLGSSSEGEEVVTYEVVKNEPKKGEPLRGSQKEKRARSRPEERARRQQSETFQRQTMSVTQVIKEPEPHLLPPLQETPSNAVIERLQLSRSKKKSRKGWPSRDLVKNVLKDPQTRPTSYFLARLRPDSSTDCVEVDYRLNTFTNAESFQFTRGSLENLLTGTALSQYLTDKANSNVDEKAVFFDNFPYIFSNCSGRIWWNGFVANIGGDLSNRMNLKTLTMDPPAFIFDLSGLRYISATRNETRLTFMGHNNVDRGEGENTETGRGQEGVKRSFVIRGKTEQDVKQLNISAAGGTTFVSIMLPVLSRASVSAKNSMVEN